MVSPAASAAPLGPLGERGRREGAAGLVDEVPRQADRRGDLHALLQGRGHRLATLRRHDDVRELHGLVGVLVLAVPVGPEHEALGERLRGRRSLLGRRGRARRRRPSRSRLAALTIAAPTRRSTAGPRSSDAPSPTSSRIGSPPTSAVSSDLPLEALRAEQREVGAVGVIVEVVAADADGDERGVLRDGSGMGDGQGHGGAPRESGRRPAG